ncbi:hypothetical protein BamIOP4010DRAFT_6177 [Burkholderia ambifaria IOP40-10]|uniref:Uncharacterized protein n=1 Tax=Burkholderia ambifaria IOP40-10 TaxID=396596 RepID=B1FQ66_9BURK|nr:hypothetical protein BamIOP4010DRAFT_6177 [Burkholderia ambifaria IOP40-10]
MHRFNRRIAMRGRARHRFAALREHHRRVTGIGRLGHMQIEPRRDVGIVRRHADIVVERIDFQRTGAAHRVGRDRRDHRHLQLIRELLRKRITAGGEIAARQQHAVAFRIGRILQQPARELLRRDRLAIVHDGDRAVPADVARLRAVRFDDIETRHLQELPRGRVAEQVHDARTRHGPQFQRIDANRLRAARRELAVHVGFDLEAREPAVRIGQRTPPSGRIVVAQPAEYRRLDQVREFLQQLGIGAAARPIQRDRRARRVALPRQILQRVRHLERAGGTPAARIDDRPAFRQHTPHVHAERHPHVARRRAAAPLIRHRARRDAAPVDRMRALVDDRQRRREPVGARSAADRMVRHAVPIGRTGLDQDAARITGIGTAVGAIARRTPCDEAACAVHVDAQHVREQLRERTHARSGAARIEDHRRFSVPAALAHHLGHVFRAHRLAGRARECIGPRVRVHGEVTGRHRHQRPLARRQPVLRLARVVRIDREVGLAARIGGPLRFAHAERRVDHVDAPAVLAANQRLLRIEAARVHHAQRAVVRIVHRQHERIAGVGQPDMADDRFGRHRAVRGERSLIDQRDPVAATRDAVGADHQRVVVRRVACHADRAVLVRRSGRARRRIVGRLRAPLVRLRRVHVVEQVALFGRGQPVLLGVAHVAFGVLERIHVVLDVLEPIAALEDPPHHFAQHRAIGRDTRGNLPRRGMRAVGRHAGLGRRRRSLARQCVGDGRRRRAVDRITVGREPQRDRVVVRRALHAARAQPIGEARSQPLVGRRDRAAVVGRFAETVRLFLRVLPRVADLADRETLVRQPVGEHRVRDVERDRPRDRRRRGRLRDRADRPLHQRVRAESHLSDANAEVQQLLRAVGFGQCVPVLHQRRTLVEHLVAADHAARHIEHAGRAARRLRERLERVGFLREAAETGHVGRHALAARCQRDHVRHLPRRAQQRRGFRERLRRHAETAARDARAAADQADPVAARLCVAEAGRLAVIAQVLQVGDRGRHADGHARTDRRPRGAEQQAADRRADAARDQHGATGRRENAGAHLEVVFDVLIPLRLVRIDRFVLRETAGCPIGRQALRHVELAVVRQRVVVLVIVDGVVLPAAIVDQLVLIRVAFDLHLEQCARRGTRSLRHVVDRHQRHHGMIAADLADLVDDGLDHLRRRRVLRVQRAAVDGRTVRELTVAHDQLLEQRHRRHVVPVGRHGAGVVRLKPEPRADEVRHLVGARRERVGLVAEVLLEVVEIRLQLLVRIGLEQLVAGVGGFLLLLVLGTLGALVVTQLEVVRETRAEPVVVLHLRQQRLRQRRIDTRRQRLTHAVEPVAGVAAAQRIDQRLRVALVVEQPVRDVVLALHGHAARGRLLVGEPDRLAEPLVELDAVAVGLRRARVRLRPLVAEILLDGVEHDAREFGWRIGEDVLHPLAGLVGIHPAVGTRLHARLIRRLRIGLLHQRIDLRMDEARVEMRLAGLRPQRLALVQRERRVHVGLQHLERRAGIAVRVLHQLRDLLLRVLEPHLGRRREQLLNLLETGLVLGVRHRIREHAAFLVDLRIQRFRIRVAQAARAHRSTRHLDERFRERILLRERLLLRRQLRVVRVDAHTGVLQQCERDRIGLRELLHLRRQRRIVGIDRRDRALELALLAERVDEAGVPHAVVILLHRRDDLLLLVGRHVGQRGVVAARHDLVVLVLRLRQLPRDVGLVGAAQPARLLLPRRVIGLRVVQSQCRGRRAVFVAQRGGERGVCVVGIRVGGAGGLAQLRADVGIRAADAAWQCVVPLHVGVRVLFLLPRHRELERLHVGRPLGRRFGRHCLLRVVEHRAEHRILRRRIAQIRGHAGDRLVLVAAAVGRDAHLVLDGRLHRAPCGFGLLHLLVEIGLGRALVVQALERRHLGLGELEQALRLGLRGREGLLFRRLGRRCAAGPVLRRRIVVILRLRHADRPAPAHCHQHHVRSPAACVTGRHSGRRATRNGPLCRTLAGEKVAHYVVAGPVAAAPGDFRYERAGAWPPLGR